MVIGPCQIETNIRRIHLQTTGSAGCQYETSKNAATDADYGRLNSYENSLFQKNLITIMKLEVDGNPLWVFNEEFTIPIHDPTSRRCTIKSATIFLAIDSEL